MSDTAGTIVRGESRSNVRARSDAEHFDAARLLRVSTGRGLRAAQASLELEETLVIDGRGLIRPAEAVEHKLVTLLEGKAVSVSQLRTASLSSRSRAAFD